MSGPVRRSAQATLRSLCSKIDLWGRGKNLSVNRPSERIFGVVVAGGKSRRFGGHKVLAPLAGSPIGIWGVRALEAAGLSVGVVSAAEGVEAALGVPARPDLEVDLGPIGGLWTALQWAEERGDGGVLLLGCDMPLVDEPLLRTIVGWSPAAPAVVPVGPTGLEPLCALYRLTCATEVERRLHSDDRSLHGLANAVGATFMGEDVVAEVTDPRQAFMNVNTPEDRDLVERLLQSSLPS